MTRRWKQPEQRRNLPSSYRQDIEHFNFTLNSDESQIPGLRGCRVRRFTCFSNVVFACWIRSSDRKRSVPLLHKYKTKSHFMLSTTFFLFAELGIRQYFFRSSAPTRKLVPSRQASLQHVDLRHFDSSTPLRIENNASTVC